MHRANRQCLIQQICPTRACPSLPAPRLPFPCLPACLPACLQARAEDYCEAVAFVRLLNALWRSGGGAELADEGRGVAHFTKFVREDLLGTAFQRAYREEAQRWQLVAACLEHCELCLAGVRSMGALAGEAAASSAAASVKPPGLEVLLDLLGEWVEWERGQAVLASAAAAYPADGFMCTRNLSTLALPHPHLFASRLPARPTACLPSCLQGSAARCVPPWPL